MEEQSPGASSVTAKTWGMHACVHDDAKEAKLSPA